MKALSLLLILATAAQCGSPSLEAFERVVYKFQDGSMAPEYHRSYQISVREDGSARLVVDSYGTEIARDSVALSDKEQQALKAALNELPFFVSDDYDDELVGGATEYLTVYGAAGKELFDYAENEGEQPEAIQSVIELLKGFFPNLQALRDLPLPSGSAD